MAYPSVMAHTATASPPIPSMTAVLSMTEAIVRRSKRDGTSMAGAREPLPTPPAAIQAVIDRFSCGHCINGPVRANRDHRGVWRLIVIHDTTCPVFRGHLSGRLDIVRAEAGTAR